ncbi:MAG: hypothetical protein M3R14_05545 [Acidobacteriota bacterium]|nr:hypothetical protein [Acidobacteriota bacterium]
MIKKNYLRFLTALVLFGAMFINPIFSLQAQAWEDREKTEKPDALFPALPVLV